MANARETETYVNMNSWQVLCQHEFVAGATVQQSFRGLSCFRYFRCPDSNRRSRYRNHKHRRNYTNLRSKASEVPPAFPQRWAAEALARRLQRIFRARETLCGTLRYRFGQSHVASDRRSSSSPEHHLVRHRGAGGGWRSQGTDRSTRMCSRSQRAW